MLKQLLDDARYDAHSEFQMDYFITAKAGGTPYGQYKQAIKELQSRLANLRMYYFEREKLKIKIEDLEIYLEADLAPALQRENPRLLALELQELRISAVMLERSWDESLREANRFYKQAVVLKKHVGDLTIKRRYHLEREMFCWLFMSRVAMELSSWHRAPGPGTMDLYHSLPFEDQLALRDHFNNAEAVAAWLTERASRQLKIPELIKEIDSVPDLELDIQALIDPHHLLGDTSSKALETISR